MKLNDQNLLVKVHGTVLDRMGSIESGMKCDVMWHKDENEFEGSATAKYMDAVSEAMKEFEERVKTAFRTYYEG